MTRLATIFLLVNIGAFAAAAMGAAPGGSGAEVRVVRDVVFLEAGRAEKLDLYLPAGEVKGAPGFVWVHGGGWTSGDKSRAREVNVATTLASWGYVVAGIDYRLGPGSWPQNLHDVKNAVRYLRAHAAEWGVDPARIAIGGGSAGGHLALMAAFTADRQFEPAAPYPGVSSAVRAVVDLYGPTNHLTRRKPDASGRATAEPHAGNAAEVFAAGASDEHAALVASSPVTHVRAGLPPVFIAHGLADATVNHEQSTELAAALAAAGVEHELILLPDVGHTFHLDAWEKKPLTRDLRGPLKAFLDRALAPR